MSLQVRDLTTPPPGGLPLLTGLEPRLRPIAGVYSAGFERPGLDSILALYKARLIHLGVELKLETRDCPPLVCYAGEIRQVLANLVGNAMDAMPGGVQIRRRRSFHRQDVVRDDRAYRQSQGSQSARKPKAAAPKWNRGKAIDLNLPEVGSFNLGNNYGPMNFDRSQVLNLSYSYPCGGDYRPPHRRSVRPGLRPF